MNASRFLAGLCLLLPLLRLSAQLPSSQADAITQTNLPPGAVGVRLEDFRRKLEDGGSRTQLDLTRIVGVLQFDVAPGVYPWLEFGGHNAEMIGGRGSGGFTWGAGTGLRPFLFPLRTDPQLGPRDWLALALDLSLRGGAADTPEGDIDWLLWEGALMLEWHQVQSGSRRSPIGAVDLTAGLGVVFSQLEAEQGDFDGSQRQPVGLRLQTAFTFSARQFLRVEADWYGASDRKLALAVGFLF